MKRDKDGLLEENAAPEGPAAPANETPPTAAESEVEEKGLTGVDAAPLSPPTREEIEALRRERDELRDQLLRKRADFENYRKRVERDRHQAGIDATASLLRALIPTLDNLDRALGAETQESPLRDGVELIRRDLVALLEGHGVVTHDPTGQKFDPQIHQALSHEVVPGVEDGTVVEVFRKGYFFKDRLLRPALVKVAKAEETGDGGEPEAVH